VPAAHHRTPRNARPTLIQEANGVRGRYRTVRTIPAEETPIGMNWIMDIHHSASVRGVRARVRVWIPFANRYTAV